jgi:hypothetical protein
MDAITVTNQPRKLNRFWSALESIPGQAAVQAEWEHLLGDDYEVVRPFLRASGRLASAYPRITRTAHSSPYRVVTVGDEQFLGAGEPGEKPIELTLDDLKIIQLDSQRFHRAIAAALEFDCQTKRMAGTGVTDRLGTLTVADGRSVPVYLTIQLERSESREVVNRLISLGEHPFLLLTPTGALVDRDSQIILDKHHCVHIAMSEALGAGSRGGFVSLEQAGVLRSRLQRPFGSGSQPPARCVFRRSGEGWHLGFGGEPLLIKDRVGLAYVHRLIRERPKELHVAELVLLGAGKEAAKLLGSAGELIDDDGRKAIRSRLEAIQAEFDQLGREDKPRREVLLAEKERLRRYVSAATRKDGKSREGASDVERLRKAVGNAIDRALKAIEKEDEPLWLHLSRAIQKGHYLSYAPDEDIDWEL